jgi:hypothetical protein
VQSVEYGAELIFFGDSMVFSKTKKRLKKFFSSKGFIGAIGDDLPSLIPIVFALLLFFTVFSATLNNYETKNEEFNQKVKMISISREIKGDSLILSLDQFKGKCNDVRSEKIPYNFAVGIYLVGQSSSDAGVSGDALSNMLNCSSSAFDAGEPGFNKTALLPDLFQDCDAGSELSCKYFCEYVKVGSKSFDCSQKNYIIKFYPVAVQTKFSVSGEHSVVAPAIMVMVVWQ